VNHDGTPSGICDGCGAPSTCTRIGTVFAEGRPVPAYVVLAELCDECERTLPRHVIPTGAYIFDWDIPQRDAPPAVMEFRARLNAELAEGNVRPTAKRKLANKAKAKRKKRRGKK
jgi:hypothetical protein